MRKKDFKSKIQQKGGKEEQSEKKEKGQFAGSRKIAEGIGERECKMMTEENTSEINIKREHWKEQKEEMIKMSL